MCQNMEEDEEQSLDPKARQISGSEMCVGLCLRDPLTLKLTWTFWRWCGFCAGGSFEEQIEWSPSGLGVMNGVSRGLGWSFLFFFV